MRRRASFEWDQQKNQDNIDKHNISFYQAQYAFADPNRVVLKDIKHSYDEKRYYCIGRIDEDVITVRFTYRKNMIRIFGAGYWRKGKKIYEEQNKLY